MLKIGFVGCGFVAELHRRALTQVRDTELTAVYRRSQAEAFAQRSRDAGLGDTQIYDSIGDMCNDVDVICNSSTNDAHVSTTQEIADAVKNGAELKGIIFEKPLARNVAEADQILELALGTGVPTAYFENNIFMPPVVNSRHQFQAVEKAMGPAHLSRTAEEHAGPPMGEWYWSPIRQGGGEWAEMGCHSVAVGMDMVTPMDKAPDYMEPISINATLSLLKWGNKPWIDTLKDSGIDYDESPAEDYALVTITFRDPETGDHRLVQATNSWMYDAPGLRLFMETYGPSYSYTVNSLSSPAELFIGDQAAASIEDAKLAVENAQATRGGLILQPNEPDLYGYAGEWRDAVAAFNEGRNAKLDVRYGRLITKLIIAGYLSHERRQAIDLTDAKINEELETYVPLIQQGKGHEVLGRS